MYKTNDVKILDPPCETMDESGYCDEWEHSHSILDSRDMENYREKIAYLPHSCEEWVIGGPEQIQQLINDLQNILQIWKGEE